MDLVIKKNGICKSLTDFKVKKDGVVKNANYLYVKKDGERKLFWQRENGPYYEAHKWLKGDNYAYIKLPTIVGNVIIKCKFIFTVYSGNAYGRIFGNFNESQGYTVQFQNVVTSEGPKGLFARYYVNAKDTTIGYCKHEVDNEEHAITISSDSTMLDDSVIAVGRGSYTDNYSLFNNRRYFDKTYPNYNGVISLYQDDNCSLTPCKLTKTLPSDKAWDGNSHTAGECGMWDSVSDKFYGNASSSGSFSVSDED